MSAHSTKCRFIADNDSAATAAVSYRNTVIVNGNLGMHGMIPKSLWLSEKNKACWFFTEGKM